MRKSRWTSFAGNSAGKERQYIRNEEGGEMKLIFVYNADSGLLNTAKDISHKLFSPQTYDCFLCSLTHGTFKENPEWREFRNNSAIQMVFLHRDEFEKQYNIQQEYPVILEENGSLQVRIPRARLASFAKLDDLIHAIQELEQNN